MAFTSECPPTPSVIKFHPTSKRHTFHLAARMFRMNPSPWILIKLLAIALPPVLDGLPNAFCKFCMWRHIRWAFLGTWEGVSYRHGGRQSSSCLFVWALGLERLLSDVRASCQLVSKVGLRSISLLDRGIVQNISSNSRISDASQHFTPRQWQEALNTHLWTHTPWIAGVLVPFRLFLIADQNILSC